MDSHFSVAGLRPLDHTTLMALRDHLRWVLMDLAQQREDHRSRVDTPSGLEMQWVVNERNAMLTEINLARQGWGKPPIQLEQVQRVENHAVGHSDYMDKFALYCAKLAVADDLKGGRASCEVIIGQFVWGPQRCGKKAVGEVQFYSEDEPVFGFCDGHRPDPKDFCSVVLYDAIAD
jgi:hypothetical protein